MLGRNLLTLGLIASLLVSAATPVTAGNLRDFIKDKPRLKEEIKAKIASDRGLLKLFRNGHVAIGSGELTAINGTTLTVKKDNKSYTVLTDDKTQFRRKFWGKSDLSEFTVGDRVNVIGTWEDEAKTTIKARFVRDTSIQMRHGVFFGKVTAKTDTGFTMDTVKRGTQTVTVSADTQYTNRREETITFADVQAGHKVRVRGLWNSLNSTITEVSRVKDFSLPPHTSPQPQTTP